MGNATAVYNGTLTVQATGEWEFEGTVQFEDVWDFNLDLVPWVQGELNRSWKAQLKVAVANIILFGGEEFKITTDEFRIRQRGSTTDSTSGPTLVEHPDYRAGYVGDYFGDLEAQID